MLWPWEEKPVGRKLVCESNRKEQKDRLKCEIRYHVDENENMMILWISDRLTQRSGQRARKNMF